MPPEGVEYLENGYNFGATEFWTLYGSEAEQHDKNTTETWKADMDSTLIFAGLFSATVTAFIIESYKLLKQDSGDVTNTLLTQILTAQTTLNVSAEPLLISPTPFTPSTSAVVVNILWFLSLACSLTAALCVTLVQEWVRDYLQRIQRQNQPLRRARVRAFLFNGMDKWKMDEVVEYVPTFLHASLFLFFAGLCVFLSPLSIAVTAVVASAFLCCVIAYGLATFAPLFDPATPYQTQVSSIFWRILQHAASFFPTLPHYFAWYEAPGGGRSIALASPSLTAAREELALSPSRFGAGLERDAEALLWVYDRLHDHRDFLSFVRSIPEFLDSADGRRAWTMAFMEDDLPNSTASSTSVLSLTSFRNDSETRPWAVLEGRIFAHIISSYHVLEDPQRHSRRIAACVDGLFAIWKYQLENLPSLSDPEPPSNLSLFSYHSLRADGSDKDDPSMGKAVCAQALQRFRYTRTRSASYHTIDLSMAKQADQAIQDLNIMRQTLESVLAGVALFPGDLTAELKILSQLYFGVLRRKSLDLSTWMHRMHNTLVDSNMQGEPVLQWAQYLPPRDARLQVVYHDIPSFDIENLTLDLYALQLAASLRGVKAYPLISELLPSLSYTGAWFSFFKEHLPTQWKKEREYFDRELQPIASLLDLLVRDPEECDVEIRKGSYEKHLLACDGFGGAITNPRQFLDAQMWAMEANYARLPLPLKIAPHGPCSIWAYILDDLKHAGRVITLLSLISDMTRFSPRTIDPQILKMTLRAIGFDVDQQLLDVVRGMSEGSQVLFVFAIHEVIGMERRATPAKPCLFPKNSVTRLLSLMECAISYNASLQTAEYMFGVSAEQDPPLKALNGTLRDEDSWRIQHVCDHIRAQRASEMSRAQDEMS